MFEQPPKNVERPKEEKMKLIDFRFKQSNASRLAEYITGMRPDDPRMVERIIEDQKIVMAKYGLPPREMRFSDPSEYERRLREIVKKNGNAVRGRLECGKFFETYSSAKGLYSDDSLAIFLDIDRNGQSSDGLNLGALAHEVVHSEQSARQKGMPIELQEYEAYIIELSADALRRDPQNIDLIFGYLIGRSVRMDYQILNEKKRDQSEPDEKPVWDNPEYFLRNIDHIDQSDIDRYKEKMKSEKEAA